MDAQERLMPPQRAGRVEEGPRRDARVGRPETLRVWLLGGFRVSVGTRTVEEDAWRLRKAAALVKLLALAPGHHLHREQAMDLLWSELGLRAASNNLHQALYVARRTLHPDPAIASRYLSLSGEQLALCPEGRLWVDVEAFEEAAATAHRSREPAAYRAAIELYSGELLPEDRYEEWAESKRQELRRLYLSVLVELAGLYEEGGEHERGLEALQRVLAEESTLEEAHAGLMRLYALMGREGEALAQYEWLRDILSRELGAEPSTATCRLRDEIGAGRFLLLSQPVGHLPEEPPDPSNHNLPATRTSFVGREREMLEVKRELAMTRLLTLTGAGGSGKTRLALEVAYDLVGVYPDGVWLVELAPLSEGTLVLQAVADVLGVQEQPGQPLLDTLAEAVRSKKMLLILDNCEHLVEAAASLVDVLLNSCPRLRVLATSREALDVVGEVRWIVPPLSVPVWRSSLTAEELEGYASARLFFERASDRHPGFVATTENARAVAEICQRLDGVPLAIELAAARVGALSVEQISERLEDSLKLLTSGGRTRTSRQRTLRGALDWSHELLSVPERVLFRRLSVFAGGWTLETTEVVGSGEGVEEEVLDLLSGLVEKSLIVAEGIGEGGKVRYRMLEPIRQYALEKLEESEEAEPTKRSHAQHFLDLAEVAEPELLGPREVDWFDRLEVELDNIRAALSWSLGDSDPELGLRLVGALRLFWLARGYYGEGRRWIEEALAREGGASAKARVKALGAASVMARRQGDYARAKASSEEGLRLSAEAGVRGGHDVAFFTNMLAQVSQHRGYLKQATKLAEVGLTLSREANDAECIGDALLLLGHASSRRGDYEQAQEFYDEGLALSRESGSALLLSDFLNNLGRTFLFQGDLEQATAFSEEAAALTREVGDRFDLKYPLSSLGWVALLRGDLERAKALHKESLALCHEHGDKVSASYCLEGLACVAGAEREAKRAARLFGAAEALREAIGVPLAPDQRTLVEPYLVGAHSQLEEATWHAAFTEGKDMTLEEAAEYALSDEKPMAAAPKIPEGLSTNAQSPAALTRREEEVAVLVAQGLTNRRIAKELVLSERTVENHIRNILKKLKLSSRSEVAAWVEAQHS